MAAFLSVLFVSFAAAVAAADHRFVLLWSCGCVFAEKCLTEIPHNNKCLVCSEPFTSLDIIRLCGDDDDRVELFKKMLLRREAAKVCGLVLAARMWLYPVYLMLQ